jgi:hypothetical protein
VLPRIAIAARCAAAPAAVHPAAPAAPDRGRPARLAAPGAGARTTAWSTRQDFRLHGVDRRICFFARHRVSGPEECRAVWSDLLPPRRGRSRRLRSEDLPSCGRHRVHGFPFRDGMSATARLPDGPVAEAGGKSKNKR